MQKFDALMEEVKSLTHDLTRTAIKGLLESKHLYQCLEVDLDSVKARISNWQQAHESNPFITTERAEQATDLWEVVDQKYPLMPWFPIVETGTPDALPVPDPKADSKGFTIELPSVKIACGNCDAVLPAHNSGYPGCPKLVHAQRLSASVEIFTLPYQCQACRSEPIVFVIKRSGLRLQLIGRSQFEPIELPRGFPKQESGWYRKAIVSSHAGHLLAGLFYLRTTIEQYMRRETGAAGKLTGDELATEYAKRLPKDLIASPIPSFKALYDNLSEKLHAAEEDQATFDKACADIGRHFEILKIFPLVTHSESRK
jgi:hypothetical protein